MKTTTRRSVLSSFFVTVASAALWTLGVRKKKKEGPSTPEDVLIGIPTNTHIKGPDGNYYGDFYGRIVVDFNVGMFAPRELRLKLVHAEIEALERGLNAEIDRVQKFHKDRIRDGINRCGPMYDPRTII